LLIIINNITINTINVMIYHVMVDVVRISSLRLYYHAGWVVLIVLKVVQNRYVTLDAVVSISMTQPVSRSGVHAVHVVGVVVYGHSGHITFINNFTSSISDMNSFNKYFHQQVKNNSVWIGSGTELAGLD
jgi:hypothetical protein